MLEVIVVDDGSPDDTSDVALSAKDDLHDDPLIDVRLLRHVRNRGKGAAVRTGVLGARGGVIVFTDADLAYGTTPLGKIIATIEAGADVVVGERHRHRSRLRGIAGFAFAQVVRVAGLGTSADPQCGIKGFSAAAAQLLFGLATIDGFAIDVEILYLARAYGLDVRTIEVEMREPEHSSVNLVSDARQMLASLRAIRRASAAGRYEIPAPSPRARVGFPR